MRRRQIVSNKVERRKVTVWMLETVAHTGIDHRIAARAIKHSAFSSIFKNSDKKREGQMRKKHEDGVKSVMSL